MSMSDRRVFDSLAKIAVRHKIPPAEFYASLLKARSKKSAVCGDLVVEYRGDVEGNLIFLFTKGNKLVSQFLMPEDALRKEALIEEAIKTLQRRRRPSTLESKREFKIRDLWSGLKHVNVQGRVVKISEPREILTQYGTQAHIALAKIKDETGSIELSLWDNQIKKVKVGDLIRISDGYIATFNRNLQLRVRRGENLQIISES